MIGELPSIWRRILPQLAMTRNTGARTSTRTLAD